MFLHIFQLFLLAAIHHSSARTNIKVNVEYANDFSKDANFRIETLQAQFSIFKEYERLLVSTK